MREHKYKAWDKKLKKILPVAIINFEDGIVQAKNTTSTGTSFSGTYAIRTLGLDSLIQNTGLKDKKGKEIYEGDILKVGEEEDIGEVKYFGDKDYPAFDLDPRQDYEYNNLSVGADELEIIGNKFENKELLK